jgi:hypothetical protein
MTPATPHDWRSLATVLATALAVLAAGDLALRTVAPIPHAVAHVAEGVAELEDTNPEVMVLGSSHTRAFRAVETSLEAHGRSVTLVPVEMGTFEAYLWVAEQRVAPALDDLAEDGRQPRLKDVILVTQFYDICHRAQYGAELNIPARAWAPRHFFADLLENGFTNKNRNYVRERWRELLPFSTLAAHRGTINIPAGLREWALGPSDRRIVDEWRTHIEAQAAVCDDSDQKRAFERLHDFFAGRGVRVTVVKFPLLRELVTDRARTTTLAQYDRFLDAQRTRRDFHVVEMTLDAPLTRDDFNREMDHLLPKASPKFAEWALGGELGRVLAPEGEGS